MSGPFRVVSYKEQTAVSSTEWLSVEASIRLKPDATQDDAEALRDRLNDDLAPVLAVADKVEQPK